MSDVAQLRRNYLAVSAWMVECGEWTPAEADEIGLAIKSALDQQDTGYLAWWAEWMARWADVVASFVAHEAAMYQRALAEARKAKGLAMVPA